MSGARNLLLLNSYHYRRGGADVVYLDQESMFAGLGWRTAVMAMHHPKNQQSDWSEWFVDELEFGKTQGLPDKLLKASKVIWSFEAQRKLRGLLGAFRPDVAHLHNIYHHLSPSVLPVLAGMGIPTVLTAHDLKIACPAYKMLNSGGLCERCRTGSVVNVIRHRCVRNSIGASTIIAVESGLQRMLGIYRRHLGRVIAPSRFYRDKLIEWGWAPEQLAYVPNYVDAEAFTPSFKPSGYVLFAGRLAPEKGVDTLVSAALAAGVELRVAGTGPMEAQLRALPGAERIEWLGFLSGEALSSQIRGARALVLPSEWYENAPMSLLEAYASGTPVVGARIGGIPEMISNETGWVFSAGNAEDLASVLQKVADTPDSEIAAMGRNARARVVLEFGRELHLERVLAVYRSLGVHC